MALAMFYTNSVIVIVCRCVLLHTRKSQTQISFTIFKHLLAICKRKLISFYSMSTVLHPIVEDLKVLVSYIHLAMCILCLVLQCQCLFLCN